MEQSLKMKIATQAAEYAKKNKLSNNDVAKASKLNPSYISAIFRGQFTTEANGKEVVIGDRQFYQLAAWAGIAVEKVYWKVMRTIQFDEIIAILVDAKKMPRAYTIIAETGDGKSQAVDQFCKKNPLNTFRITVGGSYKLKDIINELLVVVGGDLTLLKRHNISTRPKLESIISRLIDIRHSGGKPVVIIDEAENLPPSVVRMLKELYDAVIKYCSIVLIGTPQIIEALFKNTGRQSVPQTYRRFKAGIREITPLLKSRDFVPFFDEYNVDPSLQTLLFELADNYGELHDYLEPVLRYADESGKLLTEHLFRIYHNIPDKKAISNARR